MEIKDLDVRKDKNGNLYVVVSYLTDKGKDLKKVLNHYDIAFAVREKINYEVNKKKGK